MRTFRPHPFRWVPAAGRRHATEQARPGGYQDIEVTTLCGERLVGDESVTAWLWETCDTCRAEANRLAEIDPIPRSAP